MRLAFLHYLSSTALLAFALIQSASLSAQTYGAGFEASEWTAKSGSFACSLSHEIPEFGRAEFVRKTASSEAMELVATSGVRFGDLVMIDAVPPVWRSDIAATRIGVIQRASNQSLRVTSSQIDKVAAMLEQGTNIVFSNAQTNANGTSLRVALEARNFIPAYGKYKKCISDLIPYTFDQIARLLTNYAPAALELNAATKAQLDKVARYTKADPGVIGILVDAHSDKLDTPEESDAASQVQAELVTDYLIDKGVAENIITTRWHGDKFPIGNNQNKAGQPKNRRVTIRLESETTRKQMEKKIAAIIAAEERAAEKKAAAEKAAQEKAAQVPEALPASLQQLEQMVEEQDLTSGKQPRLR